MKFTGAYNMHLPGVYKDVCILDVSSQYPNVIRSLNLSIDTFIDFKSCEIENINYDKPLYNSTNDSYEIMLSDNISKIQGIVKVDKNKQGIIIKVINKFLDLKNEQARFK